MNVFDIIIVVISVFSFVGGWRRGLIGEVASILALVIGVYGAVRFCPVTEQYIAPYLAGFPTRLVAFAVTLVILVVAVHFVAKLVTGLVNIMQLSVLNRIGGGALSVVKYIFLVSCVVGLLNRFWFGEGGFFSKETREGSVTYSAVEAFSAFAFPYIDKGVDAAKSAATRIDDAVVNDVVPKLNSSDSNGNE